MTARYASRETDLAIHSFTDLTISQVKRVLVHQRENAIINRLNKTKVEKHPDLRQEKEDRLKELRKKDQAAQLARVRTRLLKMHAIVRQNSLDCSVLTESAILEIQKKAEDKQKEEWAKQKYQKDHAYDEWNDEDAMQASSNQNRDEDWEDDFM